MKALLLFLAVSHSFLTLWAKDSSTDRTNEFFEKLYDTKIEGVKLLEEYSDPDQFYSAIAKQVGIRKWCIRRLRKNMAGKMMKKIFSC